MQTFSRRGSTFINQSPKIAHLIFNEGRKSTECVHDLDPIGNKYDQGGPQIREQNTFVEKIITEVEQPETDIHSKLFSNPEIHLPVPSNTDKNHKYFKCIYEIGWGANFHNG